MTYYKINQRVLYNGDFEGMGRITEIDEEEPNAPVYLVTFDASVGHGAWWTYGSRLTSAAYDHDLEEIS